jgi:hypothetical protein
MFQVYRDFEKQVAGRRNVEQTRELNPQVQTFGQWLTKHGDAVTRAARPTAG